MSNTTAIPAIPYTLCDGVLSMTLGKGHVATIDDSNPNFAAILSALRTKEFDLVRPLVDTAREITKLGAGLISICEGEVFYKGDPIHNTLTDRLVGMIREGCKTVAPMVNFMENAMLNPNKGAVDRLFAFLENSHLPLTPDGCFLAYRGVKADFTDKHSGTFDNSPGKIVKMDRKGCDEDSNQCCSRGLHFCSLPYLGPEGHWAGGNDNLIVIKINPRDVCAIPYTYKDTKGRCCRFEVLRTWQKSEDYKDLSKDAWEVSLVAETEEVTDPMVRAMLNLERLSEELGEMELVEVTPETPTLEDTPKSKVVLLPESISTIILGPITKATRKETIQELYKLALRANRDAFAFKKDKVKSEGDLKVTPKGNVLTFNAVTKRWEACYNILSNK